MNADKLGSELVAAFKEDTAIHQRNKALHMERIRRMHADGLTNAVICERMGLDEHRVRFLLKQMGLKPNRADEWGLL